ncbi:MAG: class I SAM-dependent methyltransferase, partial [Actinomycetota bacterium]
MSDSVSFDRAAEYYDETRGLSEEGVRRTTAVLARSFSNAARVLEVGVGTGQVALPLHDAGLDLAGIDLAQPMLDTLLEKAGGRSPFPLVCGDATRMPFRDGAFDGAFLRWVLHLIPDWRAAVHEIARVMAPGAMFAAALGSYGGRRSEIQARFAEVTGVV